MATPSNVDLLLFRVPPDRFKSFVDFLHSTLGLPLRFRDGDRWIAFAAGSTTVAIERSKGSQVEGPLLAFKVADAHGTLAALLARGASVDRPIEEGAHERTFSIPAPWGADVTFYQPLEGK